MSNLKTNPKEAHDKPPYPKQQQDFPGYQSKMSPQPDSGEKSYQGLGRLINHSSLITGGDSGIGRAVALAFAKEGSDVTINYLPEEEEDAKETERLVTQTGKRCFLIPGDLRDDNFCKKLVEEAVSKMGKLDVVVNNAAYQGKASPDIQALDYERVMRTFATNIVPMFSIARYAVPHLKPGSVIINTGSIQAYNPSSPILDYATTKAAIHGFTKGLSQQLVEKGIRVNCVAPGPVWTPLIVQSFDAESSSTFAQDSPIGRPAQPTEMAPAYVFLASDEARYVNGSIIGATGGFGFLN